MEEKYRKRILHVDLVKVPKVTEVSMEINNAEDVKKIYRLLNNSINPKSLFLNCLALPPYRLNHLLKFLEEYPADVEIVIKEPVPPTIYSRMTVVHKHLGNIPSCLTLRTCILYNSLSKYSPKLMSRVFEFFGESEEAIEFYKGEK